MGLDYPRSLDCGGDAVEPLYGATYLPRKFKIAVAIPPHNDVDVFAHCLALLPLLNPENYSGSTSVSAVAWG